MTRADGNLAITTSADVFEVYEHIYVTSVLGSRDIGPLPPGIICYIRVRWLQL